jgi:hypothetical protein
MNKLWMGVLALGAGILFAVTATSQPRERDEGRDKKDRPPPRRDGGFRPSPPPFEPGRLLPPPIKDELRLTRDQEKALQKLEKEVKERLLKILTPAQKKKLEEMQKRGPRRPPRDGRRPPPRDRRADDRRPPPRDRRADDRKEDR